MRLYWVLAVACLGACGGPDSDSVSPDAAPVETVDAFVDGPIASPGACSMTVALDTNDAYRYFDSLSFGETGSTFCLTLDATKKMFPTYFEVQTKNEPGKLASFRVALFDASNQLIKAGYDAPLVTNETYATLSMDLDAAVYPVKLVVWTRHGQASTSLHFGIAQIAD
jgi:hypothetical protein